LRLVEDQRQPKRKPTPTTTTTTEIENILLEPEQNSWKLTAPAPTPPPHICLETEPAELPNVLTIIEHDTCMYGVMWERENIEREGEREDEREMRKRA
jgi:hypothetical protein